MSPINLFWYAINKASLNEIEVSKSDFCIPDEHNILYKNIIGSFYITVQIFFYW